MTYSDFHPIFSRVARRRTSPLTAGRQQSYYVQDFKKAGYPMVEYPTARWRTNDNLRRYCVDQFKDGLGHRTFVRFDDEFFFLNQDDANLFQTMQLVL